MRLYLVTTHRAQSGPPQALREESWRNTLLSFAHADVERFMSQAWTAESRILVDSGAFTAFCQGTVFMPEEYLRWADDFRSRWAPRVREVEFMNLDVLGDQDATWRNYRALHMAGLPVIPVVTHGADLQHIDRALSEGGRLALGGLVPHAKSPDVLRSWLDVCFARIGAAYRSSGVMPRVHILGIAQPWILERYPIATADASTWAYVVRSNTAWRSVQGLHRRLPPISQAPRINQFALRQKIREAGELAARCTAMWQARGISFED